jgi:hypothetical protein
MSSAPSYHINIDARGSRFYDVGGDQNNFIGITNNSVLEHVRRTAKKRPRHDSNISMSTEGDSEVHQIQHKRRKLSPNIPPCSRDVALQWPTGSAGRKADDLIVKIVQLQIDRGETDRRLELELEPLRQTLTLTNLALRTFHCTPLGQNLRHSVVPEVEQICVVLKALYDRVDRYRQGLWPTSIRNLWRKVLRRGCEVDEGLGSLRVSQQLLGGFLMALNS